jgi:CO/xanthine dehydrogenase Mo-binding subunit
MLDALKAVSSRIACVAAAALIAAMSSVRKALAAPAESVLLPPEYDAILRLAEEKVRAATQQGALGSGVPMLTGDMSSLLPWLGLATGVAIGAVVAAALLAPRTKWR